MKQEANKKSKKWLWLVIGLVLLLAVAGVVLALLLPGQQEDTDAVDAELYWNVDGAYYMEISDLEGFSGRTAAEDGNYYIKFAFQGQQVELQIVDKQLVNYIDSMQVMGLVFDTDGTVIDAVAPETVATVVARDFYVKEFTATSVTLNSSKAFNGMDMEIALTEQTGIWDVDPNAEVVGQAGELQIMDKVSVYAKLDDETAVTHVYITEHPESAEIYWRVERMYDTATKLSSRVPDENGVYTIAFAHDGEVVELKCRDKSIVDAIDTKAILAGQFALQFDEEGYIIASIDVATALRGKLLASDYHITGVDGNTYTATRLSSGNDQGKVVTFTLAENCDLFQVCQYACYEHNCGERVESLQLNDRVNIYANLDDEAILVFITRRCVDSPMYYNYARSYGGAEIGTMRKPESDGYYHYDMLVDGKIVTVRAATKEMADKMDSIYSRCMGLRLSGDVVERVFDGTCVTGGAQLGSESIVTSVMGPIVTIASSYSDTTWNALMSADCKVYNAITGEYGKDVGGTLTLQVGDMVTTYKNVHDELCVIYVMSRPVEGAKVYYNLERKYDTANQVTKREPNADGYYEFLMACEGKQVTVKTKSKGMASFIDQQLAPLVGLKINGSGVITNAYNVSTVVEKSAKACNYRYTENVTKTTFNTYYFPNNDKTKKTVDATTWKIAKDCQIYNVSTNYKAFRGEKTTLKNGDYIQAIRNYSTDEITHIFVMGRDAEPVDVPLYFHVNRMYDTETAQSTRQPDAEGWYVVELICNGQIKQYKTKDKLIIDKIDLQTGAFALVEEDGEILRMISMSTAVQGYALAGWSYNATAVTASQVTITGKKSGEAETLTLKLAKNFRAINVVNGSEDFGKQVKLYQGDKAIFYKNGDGELIYAFVQFSTGGAVAYDGHCDHCGKTVTWQPYAGVLAEGHYFLGSNAAGTQCTFGSRDDTNYYKAVLDLKGKTLTSSGRAFLVYDSLTIMDSVGGGKIVGTNNGGVLGGCIMMGNGNGELNLMGGELTLSDKSTQFGALAGVLYIGNGSTVNMTGGSITGGTTTERGGNVWLSGNKELGGGTFNMSGGTISGGTAPVGGNIYAGYMAQVNLTGGTVDGGVYLAANSNTTVSGKPVVSGTGIEIAAGVKLGLGELTEGASVAVCATGIFTDTLENADSYLTYIKAAEEGGGIIVKKDALCYIAPGDPDFVLDPDRDGMAVCPVCGGEEVAWTAVAAGERVGSGVSGHYYIKEDGTDKSTQFATTIAKDAVLCIHLNGKTLTTSGRIATVGDGGTINIMGEGTVIGSGSYTGESQDAYTLATLVANSGGTIGLYENVTVTTTAAGKPVAKAVNGNIKLYGNATIVPMDGGEGIVIEKGKLTVDKTWTGSALVKFPAALVDGVVPAANGASTGAFTGTLTLNAEGTPKLVAYNGGLALEGTSGGEEEPPVQEGAFVLDPDGDGMAVCPVCGGEEVQWTPIADGDSIGAVRGQAGKHYYLAEDVTYTGQFMTMVHGEVCLHLNSKDLTYGTRMFITTNGSSTIKNKLNIMGDGSVTTTSTAADSAMIQIAGGAEVNLYGGTYKCGVAGVPVILSNTTVNAITNLHDSAVIDGDIALGKGTVSLNGASSVTGMIAVAASGKLSVAGDWTGTAKVIFENALVDGVVPTANGASTGDFTGKLTLNTEGEPQLVAKDGALAVKTQDDAEDGNELVLDANKNGYCEACDATVQWTDLNSLSNPRIGYLNSKPSNVDVADYVISEHYHYYLSADLDYTTDAQFAERYYNINCLHLNGHNLTVKARIRLGAGATMNIMGSGSITGSCTSSNANYNLALFYLNAGAVLNLYGGNYTCTNADAPAVALADTKATAVNICGDVSIVGGVEAANGTVALSGNANVDTVAIAKNAKLSVAGDWTGTAKAAFENALEDGVVPAANGASTGDFTGKLTLNAEGEPQLVAKDGALAVLDQDPIAAEIQRAKAVTEAANAMDFSDANNLPTTCPACGAENVTWTAVNGNLGYEEGANLHYYLNKDIPTANYFLILRNAQICLHLNGKNVTCQQNITLEAGGADTTIANRLNIMGTGSITSTNTTTSQSVVYVKTAGEVNLYGGTLLSGTENLPVLRIDKAAAAVNLYDTAVLGRAADVAGFNVRISAGSFTVYGGEITGGGSTDTVTVGSGGNVYLSNVQLHMYGGKISGGKANYGGNVRVETGGEFHLHAGEVTGGKAARQGGNVLLNNGKLYVYENGTVSGGESASNGGNIHTMNAADVIETCGTVTGGKTTGTAQAHGGNISLSAGASLTVTGGQITNGQANHQGGNIHVAGNSKLVMTGGTVSDGTAAIAEEAVITNHNIWLQNGTMTMTGGTVKGTDTNENGTAIYLNNSSVLYLGGDAAVTNTAMLGNIYVDSANAKLNVLNDWTGTASVKWNAAYTAGETVANGQCGALVDGTFTAGGSYTGTLLCEPDGTGITGKEGALTPEAAPVTQ